ncbi:MAG: hypothetical protein ACO4BW_06220, partial [Nitriliruptoraceae bacterium]
MASAVLPRSSAGADVTAEASPEALLVAAAAGDERAFAHLVGLVRPRVVRAAARIVRAPAM